MPEAKRITWFVLLFVSNCTIAQISTGTTTIGTNGGTSKLAPCTEILRFDNYNDATAGNVSGQNFVFILNNGDSLFFNLKRTNDPIQAVAAPTIPATSFGRYGYNGLAGLPVLYQIQNVPGANTGLDFSNFILKDLQGNIEPNFTIAIFDAEATGYWESITLATPSPNIWQLYDSLAPTSGQVLSPTAIGLSTNMVTWVGPFTNTVVTYSDDAFSIHSPSNFRVGLANDGTAAGLEGIAVGINRRIIAINDTLCVGGNIIINPLNAPAGTTYTWSNPVVNPPGSVSGTTAQLTGVDSIKQTLVYNGTAAATVTYTITPVSCNSPDSSFTATLVFGNSSITPIALGDDTSYCGNFSRILSTGDPATVWSTGVTAPQIQVTAIGTYWAAISNGCGTASDTIHFFQSPAPIVDLGNDTTLCTGQTLQLDATNPSSTYKWQDNSTSGTYNVTTANNYSVTATNSLGCSATDVISVSYDTQPPAINLGNDTTYCGNFSRTLSTAYSNTQWSTAVTALQIVVSSPGVYSAQVSNGCGISIDSVTINQNIPATLQLSNSSASICNGDSVLLQLNTAAAHLSWSTGSSSNVITVKQPGTYGVSVWDVVGCTTTDSVVISQGAPPDFSLGSDTSICDKNGLVLKVSAPNAQYRWQDNTNDSFYHVTASGTYFVTVSNDCGSAIDHIHVEVHADDCQLLIPTAFSPNNDGENDMFRIFCQCPVRNFSMRVYNRWGELVYESQAMDDGWDGFYKEVPQPLGVFVYLIQYFNYCENKLKTVTGNITLVR